MLPRGQLVRFRLLAAGFAGAALYHGAALAIPAFARTTYSPTYPALRHIAFILVDFSVACLVLFRPPWFFWLYLLLTMQVLQGHGSRALRTWLQDHRIQWIDVATVLTTVLGLVFLYLDRQASRANSTRLTPK